MKSFIFGCIVAIALMAMADPTPAQGRKLTDEQLDKVSAGSTVPQSSNVVTGFSFEGQAGESHTVKGNGTIMVTEGDLPKLSPTLLLQGNAQQNLRSLINIVAVNSRVQVLVNLNININSTVGTLHQANASLGH